MAEELFFDGNTGQTTDFESALGRIPPGAIVIVSEQHGFIPHQNNQEKVIRTLNKQGHRVDSALEFIQRRFYRELNSYLQYEISDAEFIEQIQWGKIPFAPYKPLIWTPLESGGRAWGINADRRITSKVASCGIEGLSPDEKKELPAEFTLGNSAYLERFTETMKDHVPYEKIMRYFAAQSIWDDTMAYELQKLQHAHPERTLVVIIGDFHNAYGGGLPDRLKARGAHDIHSISQVVWYDDETKEELLSEVSPHAKWGPRGEWVWVEKGSSTMPYLPMLWNVSSEECKNSF